MIIRHYLVDIDGTVCDDIKNEDSHLYATAKPFDESRELLNQWQEEGHTVTFFTAREEKDRGVTEQWLKDNMFNYSGLIMCKPRCTDPSQEYVWIDNRKVRAVTYTGNWTPLVEKVKSIVMFND